MNITDIYISKLVELTPEQKQKQLIQKQEFERLKENELIDWIQQVTEFYFHHIHTTKGLFHEQLPELSLEKQFKLNCILHTRKGLPKRELIQELMQLLEKVEQLKNGMPLINEFGDQERKVNVADYLNYLENQAVSII